MPSLETDYLVVGAGAAGLAFADELIAHSDADVIIVDRRQQPGGHWLDAYPFLRLHQPSAFYGVNSRRLGNDTIGSDGFYERASAGEIVEYYRAVLDETLLASGRVRFLGGYEYAPNGAHRLVALDGGDDVAVSVRRKLVDATYLETPIPKTHTPSFETASGARVVPVNDMPDPDGPVENYVILGAGKTAMDACNWLLDNGVVPERIQWIRPRDAWILDRAAFQPLDNVVSVMEAVSIDLEAAATATSLDDMFDRLARDGRVMRIDESVTPTMYHCAILSQDELAQLRRITDVVRMGRVVRIEPDQIVLEQGTIPTSPDNLHVDCTASGLRVVPVRPVFEPDRVTIQQIRYCSPSFNAALIGYIEATRDDVDEQNRLCPTASYPNTPADWVPTLLATFAATDAWLAAPDINEWMDQSRVNLMKGFMTHAREPRMQAALQRFLEYREPGIAKLREFQEA